MQISPSSALLPLGRWPAATSVVNPQLWVFLVIVLALGGSGLCPQRSVAQLSPVGGSVSGKVVDGEGNSLVDAKILIVGERRFRTETDRWGYRFDHLPFDTYSVEASAPGYVTSLVEKVTVRTGDSLRIDFRLKEGKPNAVSFTTMPIIDTTTAGASYRLFDPPLGSLPLAGTLAAIERLLPQESELVSTTSIYIDGGELLPELALGFSAWRPAVGRLASELFETADLFGSRIDPRIRTLDSLQLLTRSSSEAWHGRFGIRYSGDEVAGSDQPGLSERFQQVRPHAALLLPIGSRFRLFGARADHRSRARPLDLDETYSAESLRGVRAERDDDTSFFRLNGGPVGPNLDLSASFLEIDSDERARADGRTSAPRFETSVRRGSVRLNRFSGRIGTIAQFNDRRASTAIDEFESRRVRTKDTALSLDSLISRHFMVLGLSRETTSGDLLAPPFERRLGLASPQPVGLENKLDFDRFNLSLSDRWRATRNIAVQLGVRVEELTWKVRPTGSNPGPVVEGDETWLLPRVGLAWDVFGNGEWALLLSGGEELVRQVAIYGMGLQPFIDQGLTPTDRVEVEALSLSSRYQLFPGLIVDSEIGRRKFSGERSETLRPVAEEERRLRFGAEARIGRRWLASALYELRDLGRVEPGAMQDAPPAELGTTQRTNLHLVRNFEGGWVLSGVFEYVDDFNVAMRSLGTVTEVRPETLAKSTSVSQLDLLVKYHFGQLGNWSVFGEAPKLTWRVEIQNVFDRVADPVAIPAVFLGSGSEGLYPYPTLSAVSLNAAGFVSNSESDGLMAATQQIGRRIWFGFGLEL